MTFPNPEVFYGKLTSGDPNRIAAVGDALDTATAAVRDAVRGMSSGASGAMSTWRGAAAEEFAGSTRTNATTAVDTGRRLIAASGVVKDAASAYTTVRRLADEAMQPWRGADPAASPELAMRVIRDLMRLRDAYDRNLVGLTDQLGGGGGDWSDLEHVGKGTDWIPQGLAYRKDTDQLLVTSYDGDRDPGDTNPPSRLTFVDNKTGAEQRHVFLGGDADRSGTAGDAPNHVGGIATHGDNVWVTSTHGEPPNQTSQLYLYSQDKIDETPRGETVPAEKVVDVGASSYATYADGKLWIGQYRTEDDDESPKLYGYPVRPDGSIDRSNPEVHHTPRNVQGAVVRDDEFVFSQSDGTAGSSLVTQDRDGIDWGDPSTWLGYRDWTPLGKENNRVEGIAEIDGEIVVLHEGGSKKFLDEDGEDWKADITRHSLDDLGLSADGFAMSADSLVGAAGTFDGSADALLGAADAVSGLQLVPHVLGEVPAASALSAAVTRFIEESGRQLLAGSTSVREVADGLLGSADAYRRMDDLAESIFS